MDATLNATLKIWDLVAAKYSNTDQWKGACVSRVDQGVKAGQSQNVFAGLVNRTGNYVDINKDPNNVWGINLNTCYEYCGWDKLQTVSNSTVLRLSTRR